MSDPAVATTVSELRACSSCGALVEHRQLRHLSGAVSWDAVEHDAPCCWPCLGGGVVGTERIAMLKRGEVHRRNRCTRCKLPRPIYQGQACACGNAARYISVDHEALCGLCAAGKLAVRLIDVPEMLQLLERVLVEVSGPEFDVEEDLDRLRLMLGMRR